MSLYNTAWFFFFKEKSVQLFALVKYCIMHKVLSKDTTSASGLLQLLSSVRGYSALIHSWVSVGPPFISCLLPNSYLVLKSPPSANMAILGYVVISGCNGCGCLGVTSQRWCLCEVCGGADRYCCQTRINCYKTRGIHERRKKSINPSGVCWAVHISAITGDLELLQCYLPSIYTVFD